MGIKNILLIGSSLMTSFFSYAAEQNAVSADFAFEALKDGNNFLIDIRTPSEMAVEGVASGTMLFAPYKKYDFSKYDNGTYKKQLNDDFDTKLSDFLFYIKDQDKTTIFLLCKEIDNDCWSAKRKIEEDFDGKVKMILEGFMGHRTKYSHGGWVGSGLPTSYKIPKNKIYIEE